MIPEAERSDDERLFGAIYPSSSVHVEGIIGIRNKMLHFMGYCEDESG